MEVSLGGSAHGESSHASHVDDDRKVRIGMFFYLLCDVMFALFMVSAYIFLRAVNVNNLWFPAGTHRIDPAMATGMLALLVASSLFFVLAHVSVRNGNRGLASLGIVLGALLWIATLVGNIYYMGHLPFTQTNGGFAEMYVLFLGYHIFHLVFGLMYVIGVTVRTLQGRYSVERHLGYTTVGYYWYWTLIFGVIGFLLPVMLP
ncbi:MAG TPA: cytochrome c oxidase subunit 3 [Ktedonobacterales bacterium]